MRLLRISTALALVLNITLFSGSSLGTATLTLGYESQEASFSVRAKNQSINFKTSALFVLPGEKLNVAVENPDMDQTYSLAATAQGWVSVSPSAWEWKAPAKAGVYPIRIEATALNEAMTLNVFVMVPASKAKNGVLNGYKIGSYPKKALKNMPIYQAPVGFVEVTAENRHMLVSPHFRLSQFLCKQDGSYPKYVVLREPLLAKLETLLAKVNKAGYVSDSFHVMSGYRTPYYNRAIGNVAYSRHQWGDAADIFIDQNRDGVMDDLNADGKVDKNDCQFLTNLINDIHTHSHNKELLGGIGSYKSTKSHGPFVHIDARGSVKTW